MDLTESQFNWLQKRSERRTCEVKKGIGFFNLSRAQCLDYLNVENATFHAPSCSVERVEGEYAYIKAIFFGSGMYSHPVRYCRIPLSEVKVSFSKIIVFSMIFWNLVSSLWHNLFHRKKHEKWTFLNVVTKDNKGSDFDAIISEHAVCCSKCGKTRTESVHHMADLSGNIDIGTFTVGDVEKLAKTYDHTVNSNRLKVNLPDKT
jgi:hypothetical protein